MSDVVGVVAQVWRYPVKSMQGEQVDRLELGPGGAAGDRGLAVVDPAARKVLSAKRYAELLHASARVADGTVVVTLPDGVEHAADDPKVHATLSEWLGKDVRLEAPPVDGVYPMEMYTGMSDEDTPLFDWPGPPGTWLDLADAHWLTTASLAAAAALHPAGAWDVRRFRPTALFEVAGDTWVEDGWAEVHAGSVHSEVLMPTMRCSMPPRAQPGLEQDKAIAAVIRDHHDNNMGVYAKVTERGVIAVGDEVSIVQRSG
jgi:uncharacterized protein YcbX